MRQERRQHKGRGDADMAGQHGSVTLPLQFFRFDAEPHQEHEHDDADLAESVEKTKAGRWEQIVCKTGSNPSQQRWAQHDAGKHLAHHAWLLECAGTSSPMRRQTASTTEI